MLRPALYRAAWLLPVSQPPIPDGGILVDGHGRIAAVGPFDSVPAPADAERIDLGEAILLPGLVNAHVHAELAAFRGLLEDLPFQHWIPAIRRIKRAALPSPDELRAAALWTCAESLAAGITCFGATEDSDAAVHALRESGMRGVVFREVFGPDPAQAEAAAAELRERVAALRSLETDLVRIGASPHAPYTISDELFVRVALLASEEALPLAVHAAEAEVEELCVVRGEGPFAAGLRTRGIATPARARSSVALLERTGVLARAPLVIHAVRIDAADIRLLADAGASVAHCPIANARLGHGTAPVVELRREGVNVALGTDSVASNNRLDILEEARTAQLLQRARLESAGALPAAELLELATLAGARALGVEDRCGSLDVGKDADLCAVRLDRIHATPAAEPLAALFHSLRGSDVVLTAVRGRVLYRAGEHTTLDVGLLRPAVQSFAARLGTAAPAPT